MSNFPCPNCTEIIHVTLEKPRPCPKCQALLGVAKSGPDRGRAIVLALPQSEDPNTEAARIVGESTGNEKPLPADLEAAWAEWRNVHKEVRRDKQKCGFDF